MRLLSLELEKFGAFAALRIAFRRDARLHVVYGPNEAGKSTALAAVGALLFGVPERTPYASRFPAQLRIGAEIATASGRALKFWRRKGRKATLLEASGSPLPDDALAPFLGGLSQEVFERSFGLDAARLRAGGDEMLRADGDVGSSLLAAASGLRGLSELRRSLDEEADGVFAARKGRERRFYQVLDRFDAARQAIREKEIRSDAWMKLNGDIAALGDELRRLGGERRAGDVERARLNRLKRAAPLLNPIQALEAEAASFDDLPPFAPGVAQGLREALDELRFAGEEAERARLEEERLAQDLEAVTVDEAALADAVAIAELFQASGGYAKEKTDLPGVQRAADNFLAALERHAQSLGLPDVAALESARPTEARKSEARKLIKEGRAMEAAAAAKAAQLAQAQKSHDEARIARESEGAGLDPGPLREKYAALGKVAEAARRAAESRVALTKEERELADSAARLDPPVEELEAIARRPIPSNEDLGQFAARIESAVRAAREAVGARETAEREMSDTRARLAQLSAGRPLATAERIMEARSRREAAWLPLRAAVFGAPETPPAALLVAQAADFERLVGEADRLADDAIEDANRLVEHKLETARLDDQARRHALEQAAEDRAAAKLTETEQSWRDLWKGLSIRPHPPARMQDWHSRLDQLMTTRDRLAARRAELEAKEADIARLEPALRGLGVEAGLTAIEGLDCVRLAERFERRLDEIARAWETSRALETRFMEARRRLAEAKAESADAAAQLEDWRRRWRRAAAALGLETDASIEGAETGARGLGPGLERRRQPPGPDAPRCRHAKGHARVRSRGPRAPATLRAHRGRGHGPGDGRAPSARPSWRGAGGPGQASCRSRAQGDGATSARRGAGSPRPGQGDDGDARRVAAGRLRSSRPAGARGRASPPRRDASPAAASSGRSRRGGRRGASDRGIARFRSRRRLREFWSNSSGGTRSSPNRRRSDTRSATGSRGSGGSSRAESAPRPPSSSAATRKPNLSRPPGAGRC